MANWPIFVFRAVNVYNNATTIFDTSPSQLMFGYSSFDVSSDENLVRYVKRLFNTKEFHVNMIDATILQLEHQDRREIFRNSLVDKRMIARNNLKLLNDPKANHNSYSVGEYVQTKKFAKHHKTDPNFEGPFVISEVLDKNAYKLKDINGNTIKGTYNLQHLRPAYQYYGSPLRSISDFSEAFGNEERKFFKQYYKEYAK